MSRRAFPFALLLALGPASPRVAHAGPWTREFGSYYAKLGADFYTASSYFDPGAARATGQSYFGQQYGVYGEVGVLPVHPMQASLSLPVTVGTATFHDPRLGDETGTASSTRLGDMRFALQTALLQRGLQVAVAGEMKLPLYSNGSLREGQGPFGDYIPAPGDGQIDLTGWVVVGETIPGFPGWFEAAIGYRHRTEVFVGWDTDAEVLDGIPFRGLLGVQLLGGRLLAMANVDGIQSFESDRYTRQNVGVGPSVLYTIWNGLAVEARFHLEVAAENQGRGTAFGFGVSHRRPE